MRSDTSSKTPAVAAILACLVLAAAPLAAASAETGWEDFRRQLHAFVGALEQLPGFDSARVADMQQEIAVLGREELELMARRFRELPGDWQRLPEVLHSLAELKREQQRQLVESFFGGGPRMQAAAKHDPAAELERFRTELGFFVARLRAFAPAVGGPELEARLDRVERNLDALPTEALPELRRWFYRWAPAFKARLRGVAPPAADDKLIFGVCDGDCSFPDVDCFVTEINCDITEAGSQLTDLANAIDNFFDDIVDDISSFFTETIPEVVETVGEFFIELGNDLLDLLEVLFDLLLDEISNQLNASRKTVFVELVI